MKDLNTCIVCGDSTMASILLCAEIDGLIMTFLVCSDACAELYKLNPLAYESKGEVANKYVAGIIERMIQERNNR